MKLTAQESDRHKEARALARSLIGFFDEEERRAREEMEKIRGK